MTNPSIDNTSSAATETHQGIFLMIPGFISDDADIDDSTAILFGRIMQLSNAKGYCWASDEYLANLTRVSVREVKYRIKKLEDKGYITRDTHNEGFCRKRKIYPIYSQKTFTKGTPVPYREAQASPSVGNTCAHQLDKHNNINQSNNSGAGLFDGLDLSDDDIRYLKKFDVGLVADAVLLVKKIEVKTTIAQALKWLVQKPRNQWPKPSASPADNETYAKAEIEKIKDLIPEDFRFDWLIGSLEIVSGNWCLILEYKDPKMKEKLDEWILKVKSR